MLSSALGRRSAPSAPTSGSALTRSPILPAGRSTSTTSAARSAVTIPTTKVAPVAIENAVWMPSTMAGISGSTGGRNCSGTSARMGSRGRRRSSGRSVPIPRPRANWSANCGGHAGRRRAASASPRAGPNRRWCRRWRDRRCRRPAGTASGCWCGAELTHRHGVLHGEREDRERRADAEARRRPSRARAAGRRYRAGCW